jgi:hypothetical protein
VQLELDPGKRWQIREQRRWFDSRVSLMAEARGHLRRELPATDWRGEDGYSHGTSAGLPVSDVLSGPGIVDHDRKRSRGFDADAVATSRIVRVQMIALRPFTNAKSSATIDYCCLSLADWAGRVERLLADLCIG